jgi:L-lysine 6-transaminase
MIQPQNVHETLARYQLADGLPFVLDLARSHGSWLFDAVTGEQHLDFFTCFASWPIGYNHPGMSEPGFVAELTNVAGIKPSNSDLYTESMARFVEAFGSRVSPEGFDHHFWVSGGALAVENALKTAFDWKARRLGRTDLTADVNDLSILHFRQCFHGRSGYTMSLTNTDPGKIGLFPKFDWPRVHNPFVVWDADGNVENDVAASEARALEEIEAAYAARGDTIAGIILEPMQGEGGDNHFRPEFFRELRRIADAHDSLLIYDEVQTGFFGAGKEAWLWQQKGVAPDVVAFGKKTQVCGIYAGKRIDEVEDNVFALSGRINSTWGGNLVDMVRGRRFIEIILDDGLHENVAARGEQLVSGLRTLARERGAFSNVRGIGSLIAFTFDTPEQREEFLAKLLEKRVLALRAGVRSIRFRLPFVLTADEADEALGRVADCIPASVS